MSVLWTVPSNALARESRPASRRRPRPIIVDDRPSARLAKTGDVITMKAALRTSILLLGLSGLALTAQAQPPADPTSTMTKRIGESVAATSARLQSYSFDALAGFTAFVKTLGTQADSDATGLSVNYIEMEASPARRAAMNSLHAAQADFKEKVAALDNVAPETWENTKTNIITAWQNLQGALEQARAKKP
jgi:hypothetical protein